MSLFPSSLTLTLKGAVASMFWVDAELGSDIYLDGEIITFVQTLIVGVFDLVFHGPVTNQQV